MSDNTISKRHNPTMKCLICGKQSKRLGQHISLTHKITAQQYYDIYFKKPNEGICPMCGKNTPFLSINLGYQKHCCAKCGIDNPQTKENFTNTMIDKYGVPYMSQNPELIKKVKQTKLVRYGDENYNNRIKAKETNLEKYGVEHPTQSELVKQKIINTNLDKYGVEYNFQRKETIQKGKQTKLEKYGDANYNNLSKNKQTCLERYGTEFATQSTEFKEKVKQTNLNKYGVVCTLQSDEVREKIKQQNQEKYGVDWYVETDEFKEKAKSTVLNGPNSIDTPWRSKAEDVIIDVIKSIYNNDIYTNNKKVIYPKELDIYIPDLNIAIEFNGIIYHSDAVNYPKNAHLNKSLLCREKGIRLIHIYEFEDFTEQLELLKSLILGEDKYPKEDFNKNNLIDNIPQPEIIYQQGRYTIYGAGKLYK